MIEYVLVLVFATGDATILASGLDIGACTANAQRITARNAAEQRTGRVTYPGLVRTHCERIDR